MSWVTAQLVLPRKPPKGRAKETSPNRMQALYSELIALSVSQPPITIATLFVRDFRTTNVLHSKDIKTDSNEKDRKQQK